MKKLIKASKLTVIVGSDERQAHHPLYEQVVKLLRERGIDGVTVLKGSMSFGHSEMIHSEHNEVTMENLPMIIEAIDTEERISAVADEIANVLDPHGVLQIQPTTIALNTDSEGATADASERSS